MSCRSGDGAGRAMGVSGEECDRQKEQHMQRPRGRTKPGVLEEAGAE